MRTINTLREIPETGTQQPLSEPAIGHYGLLIAVTSVLLSVMLISVALGLTFFTAVGISLISLGFLTIVYTLAFKPELEKPLEIKAGQDKAKEDSTNEIETKTKEKSKNKKKNPSNEYVALGENPNKSFLSRQKKAKVLRQQAMMDSTRRKKLERLKREEELAKKAVEVAQPIVVQCADNIEEEFKADPLGHLVETQKEIMNLIQSTHKAFNKLEEVFGSRLHKNTRNDIANFLLLRRLHEALNLRLEQIVDTLDLVETEQKLNVDKGFFLAHGPLTLSQDSMHTVSDSDDIPPIERDAWESTLKQLIKQIIRKKTFRQALNTQLGLR